MTEAFKREKVFRDPVHDYIHVQHPIILELINSREMQRLRRIKQIMELRCILSIQRSTHDSLTL